MGIWVFRIGIVLFYLRLLCVLVLLFLNPFLYHRPFGVILSGHLKQISALHWGLNVHFIVSAPLGVLGVLFLPRVARIVFRLVCVVLLCLV